MTETLSYIVGVLAVALGIGFSIGLHELGHLMPAKLFGIKVPTYAIGFGPTLFKKTFGETTYALKLIPLGGYITMIGMYPPAKPGSAEPKGYFGSMITAARDAHAKHITPADANRKFYQLPVAKRLVIMFGGPFMNLVLGTILLTVALSGIGVQQRSLTVAEVSSCVIQDPSSHENCLPTDPQSPAIIAGMQPGDKISHIDGHQVKTWNELGAFLKAGKQIDITVVRGQQSITLPITPISALRANQDSAGNPITGADGSVLLVSKPVLGIALDFERQPLLVTTSLQQSASAVAQVGNMLVNLPQQITQTAIATFSGEARDQNGAISVVGIGQIAGGVSASETATFTDKLQSNLLILASLNFALFAFNMVPLLPLDGGHIAGGIYEWVKRAIFKVLRKPAPGPVDTALLMPATWFVFLALMAMSAVLIIADIVNPIRF